MPQLLKLRNRVEFVKVASKGRYIATKGLVLQCLDSHPDEKTNSDIAYIGITATKKIGGAVVRNRVKRRLRALAREILSAMAKSDYRYVLIGRKYTLERDFAALKKDLKYAIHQLHGA